MPADLENSQDCGFVECRRVGRLRGELGWTTMFVASPRIRLYSRVKPMAGIGYLTNTASPSQQIHKITQIYRQTAPGAPLTISISSFSNGSSGTSSSRWQRAVDRCLTIIMEVPNIVAQTFRVVDITDIPSYMSKKP